MSSSIRSSSPSPSSPGPQLAAPPAPQLVSQPPLLPQGAAGREISDAIARIRYGSVVVHIQDGVVVQIESTEKRRFRSTPAAAQQT